MKKENYDSAVQYMRPKNGTVWSAPITLPISEEKANEPTINKWIKSVKNGVVYDVLKFEQLYTPDKKKEAK